MTRVREQHQRHREPCNYSQKFHHGRLPIEEQSWQHAPPETNRAGVVPGRLIFDVDRTRMLSSATGNADGPADSFPPDESRPSDQIVLPELFWDRAALAIGGAYRVRSFMILSARPHLGLTLCRDPGGSGTAPHQWPAFGIDDG